LDFIGKIIMNFLRNRKIKNALSIIFLAFLMYFFILKFGNSVTVNNPINIVKDYKNKDVIVMVLTTEKSILERGIGITLCIYVDSII
jgi:hypothetical protein